MIVSPPPRPQFPRHIVRFLRVVLVFVLALVLGGGAYQALALVGRQPQGGASNHQGHTIRQPFANGNGLVAWYPLDGNANDASGNSRNLSSYGNVSTVSGKFGSAYNFDGSTGYLSSSNKALSSTDNWTISAWIYPTSLNSGMIVYNGNDSGGYGLSLGSAGGFCPSGHLCGLFGNVGWYDSGYTFPAANL